MNQLLASLYISHIKTPLGTLIAISNTHSLHLLEFEESCNILHKKRSLQFPQLTTGEPEPIISIKEELHHYFSGSLKTFKTPIQLSGTYFQRRVWSELSLTPYGSTRSYKDQAQAIGMPAAFRAVANANGANKLAIIIPCHRILCHNGKLGGYSSGIHRKQWLLQHEQSKQIS